MTNIRCYELDTVGWRHIHYLSNNVLGTWISADEHYTHAHTYLHTHTCTHMLKCAHTLMCLASTFIISPSIVSQCTTNQSGQIVAAQRICGSCSLVCSCSQWRELVKALLHWVWLIWLSEIPPQWAVEESVMIKLQPTKMSVLPSVRKTWGFPGGFDLTPSWIIYVYLNI